MMYNMSTITTRALRHEWPRIKKLLSKGKITVTDHGEAVAELSAPARPWTPPDYTAIAKRNTGGKYKRVSLLDGMDR